jgi:hypothetical protein
MIEISGLRPQTWWWQLEYQKRKDRHDGASIQSVLTRRIKVEVKEASFCLCTIASLSSNIRISKKLTNFSGISKYF